MRAAYVALRYGGIMNKLIVFESRIHLGAYVKMGGCGAEVTACRVSEHAGGVMLLL